jgi:hypothetical protein
MLKTVGNPSTRYGDQTIIGGNLVIGTAGKGIDFSSDPSAPGMTSELLDDYEEGTWTPAVTSFSGTITTVGSVFGTYTKIGRQVTVFAFCTITTNGTGGTLLQVKGLPFAADRTVIANYSGNGVKRNTAEALSVDFGVDGLGNPTINVYTYNAGYPGGDGVTFIVSVTYNV